MNAVTRNATRAAVAALAAAVVVVAVRAARRGTREWRGEGRPERRRTTATLVFPRPREEVYELFRDLDRLAAALGPTVSTEPLGDDSFLWVHGGEGREPVAVVVRITGDVPDVLIAWETADPPLPHEGTVRFAFADKGTRTQVDVSLRYRWSTDRARAAGIPDDAVQALLYRLLTTLSESAPLSAP
ncbi:hypothetical protein [Rugosimonospora africana]|uniref:Polyketide cyclase / dehydrase and lipid transport n=1 Tax=Rugosimonospora africana TaxID=556532 RepID=A0A8J3QN11_9ACTN|nr:hypothetical protein [Rugosimonospora africana]GIH14013.1 hypothetical protein Raf01_21850 [Rugosimonospora africana]